MRSSALIVVLILSCQCLFAQHEGIERHFTNSTYSFHPEPDTVSYLSDTLIRDFHRFRSNYTIAPYGGMNQGNPSQAFLPYQFHLRNPQSRFIFADAFYNSISKADKTVYFDTHTAYSKVRFNTGAEKLEDLDIIFTQNATPFLNFGANYHIINHEGHFQNQLSKVNDLTIFGSFTKRRYNAYLSAVFHSTNQYENGGILSDSAYTSGDTRPENLDVNLNDARLQLRYKSLSYKQEVKFGSIINDSIFTGEDTSITKRHTGNFSILHEFELMQYQRLYEDNPAPFYTDVFTPRDSLETYDSISRSQIMNRLLLKYFHRQADSLKFIAAGVFSHSLNYYHLPSGDSLIPDYSLGFRLLSVNNQNISYRSNVQYYVAGRKQNDFSLGGKLTISLKGNTSLSYDGAVIISEPDYFLEHYNSNYYSWEQDLDKSQAWKNTLSYKMQKYHFELNIFHSWHMGYHYINEDRFPVTYSQPFHYAAVELSKDFKLGHFGLHLSGIYQYSTSDFCIHIPELASLSSVYYQDWLFDNNLLFRIGADIRYHTAFYSYAYDPATSFFYLQNEKATGNYPVGDVYLNFKVKRLRGFFRYSYVNQALMNSPGFSLLHYPETPMSLNFGFSWEFYD